MILSGAVHGIRDLMWTIDSSTDVVGYNVYRSPTGMDNWLRVNPSPVPGRFYRDATTLDEITYTVISTDWVERGELGRYRFRVPNRPLYSKLSAGRAILATGVDDVSVTVDGVATPVARVDSFEGGVWLANSPILATGSRKETMPLHLTDSSVVQATYKILSNFVEPTPEVRSFYTVVPVSQSGSELHAPGAQGSEKVGTFEVDKMDYMQFRMVEMNAWMFEAAGEPAHLLIRKLKGRRCGCVVEGQQARTRCNICYETGIVGGYYGPFEFSFLDPDTALSTEIEEAGRKVTRTSRSYLGPTPYVQEGDLILRKNGERCVIANPTYKTPRGVLLQQEFDVVRLPAGDTRYAIPLRPTVDPIVYNPAFSDSPGIYGEPVTSPTTDPTKVWENKERVPEGRTISFGNMQT